MKNWKEMSEEEKKEFVYGDNENELEVYFDKCMKERNIKHDLHVYNSSFKGYKNRKGSAFPDRFFAYNNHCYMVELKIKKRNPFRIRRQEQTMKYWQDNGGVYAFMLKTKGEIDRFWIIADDGKF
jgi:hypothetical protein